MRHFVNATFICLCVVLSSCGNNSEPLSAETTQVYMAPSQDDPKVYMCGSQGLYHLANCPNRCKDQELTLRSGAVLLGCDPCPVCFPVPAEPRPPMVYVLDGEPMYHCALCPSLDEAKILIPLSDAIEQGYVPCPACMLGLCIPGQLVYVTETGETVSHIYHYNPDCKHLDHLDAQEKLARARPYWTVYSNGIRDECDDCYEERHEDEEE